MQNPLHAKYYADRARQQTVEILENVPVAEGVFRVRFACAEMAERIWPGQFLMLRLAGCDDPLIGRPMALYDTVLNAQGHPAAIDVVYQVKGKLTSRLMDCSIRQPLEVWGPLGNGFAPRPTDQLIMVAGGIGHTPFLALAQEYLGLRRYGPASRSPARAQQVILLYGARRAGYLAGLDDFQRAGVEVRIATDDGSRGHHGLVTELLSDVLADAGGGPGTRGIVCCGPEVMMEAVSHLAAEHGTDCQVSLETPMACGVGICFSCVAKVRDGAGGWDYKRTCVEGPVFDAAAIQW